MFYLHNNNLDEISCCIHLAKHISLQQIKQLSFGDYLGMKYSFQDDDLMDVVYMYYHRMFLGYLDNLGTQYLVEMREEKRGYYQAVFCKIVMHHRILIKIQRRDIPI